MSPGDARALDDFRRHLTEERGLSPHTVRAYAAEVERLAASETCRGAGGLDRLDALALRVFLAGFHREHRPSTRRRRLAALRSFFRFRVRSGARHRDPSEGVPAPRAVLRPPSPLPAETCERLVDTPVARRDPRLAARDRALLELLYGAGLGVGELVALRVRDFDPERRELRVRRGARRERAVPLPARVFETLRRYVEGRARPGILAEPLFANQRGGPLSERGVRLVLGRRLRELHVARHASPRTLRQSYAAHLLEAGVELGAVQALLGQERLSSTGRQARGSGDATERLRRVYRRAHPRAVRG